MQMLLTDYLDLKSKNVIHQQMASTQVGLAGIGVGLVNFGIYSIQWIRPQVLKMTEILRGL